MSRGGARRPDAGHNRTLSPADTRQGQGMAGLRPSSPDFVTSEEELERHLALARYVLERRALLAFASAARQGLLVELERAAAADVDPDSSESRFLSGLNVPQAPATTIARSPVSSDDNTKGEPPL